MKFVVSLFVLAMLSGSAFAAGKAQPAWSCENPRVQKVLQDGLKDLRVDTANGTSAMSYGVFFDRISNFKTIAASKNKLICSVRLTITVQGRVDYQRARVTYTEFPNGKASLSISVGG